MRYMSDGYILIFHVTILSLLFSTSALALGSGYSAYYLGFIYETGDGVTTDVQKAVTYYDQGVKLEDTDSILRLIELIHREKSLAKQRDRIPELLKAAEDSSDSETMALIGDMYRDGEVVPENAQKAVELYRRGAEAGDAYAMSSLAACYESGYGVKENYLTALRFLRAASAREEPWAMAQLGYKYLTGDDVEQNDITARDLITSAATYGNTDAMDYMGYMYETGSAFDADPEKAIEWYRKAAENGSDYAPERLRELQDERKLNPGTFWNALKQVSSEMKDKQTTETAP